MYVEVSDSGSEPGARVSLEDSRNFTQFHVTAPIHMSDRDLARHLEATAAGSAADAPDHVLIRALWIDARVGADEECKEQFAAMLQYARSKGWFDANQGTIRAHVIRA
jgi:hypothetical protein